MFTDLSGSIDKNKLMKLKLPVIIVGLIVQCLVYIYIRPKLHTPWENVSYIDEWKVGLIINHAWCFTFRDYRNEVKFPVSFHWIL